MSYIKESSSFFYQFVFLCLPRFFSGWALRLALMSSRICSRRAVCLHSLLQYCGTGPGNRCCVTVCSHTVQVNVTSRVLTRRGCCFCCRTWTSGSSCINNPLALLASNANGFSRRPPRKCDRLNSCLCYQDAA
jgi:hypothetical protein